MIHVVSGYMRSGTSAMMRALAASGMDVRWSEERQANLTQKYGREFEYCEINPGELDSPGFVEEYQGTCIKIHMPHILKMPPVPFRVVVMRRSKEGIVKSLRQLSRNPAVVMDGREDEIEALVQRNTDILRDRKSCVSVHEVWLENFVSDPSGTLASLEWGIKPATTLKDLVYVKGVNNGY